jgi:hypothetical protein
MELDLLHLIGRWRVIGKIGGGRLHGIVVRRHRFSLTGNFVEIKERITRHSDLAKEIAEKNVMINLNN